MALLKACRFNHFSCHGRFRDSYKGANRELLAFTICSFDFFVGIGRRFRKRCECP